MLPPRVRQYMFAEAATLPALVGLGQICLFLQVSPVTIGLIQNLLDSALFYLLILCFDLKKVWAQTNKSRICALVSCSKRLVAEFSASEIFDMAFGVVLTVNLTKIAPEFGFWASKFITTVIFFASSYFSWRLIAKRG